MEFQPCTCILANTSLEDVSLDELAARNTEGYTADIFHLLKSIATPATSFGCPSLWPLLLERLCHSESLYRKISGPFPGLLYRVTTLNAYLFEPGQAQSFPTYRKMFGLTLTVSGMSIYLFMKSPRLLVQSSFLCGRISLIKRPRRSHSVMSDVN